MHCCYPAWKDVMCVMSLTASHLLCFTTQPTIAACYPTLLDVKTMTSLFLLISLS